MANVCIDWFPPCGPSLPFCPMENSLSFSTRRKEWVDTHFSLNSHLVSYNIHQLRKVSPNLQVRMEEIFFWVVPYVFLINLKPGTVARVHLEVPKQDSENFQLQPHRGDKGQKPEAAKWAPVSTRFAKPFIHQSLWKFVRIFSDKFWRGRL